MNEILACAECYSKGEESNTEKKVTYVKKHTLVYLTHHNSCTRVIIPRLSGTRWLSNKFGGSLITSRLWKVIGRKYGMRYFTHMTFHLHQPLRQIKWASRLEGGVSTIMSGVITPKIYINSRNKLNDLNKRVISRSTSEEAPSIPKAVSGLKGVTC